MNIKKLSLFLVIAILTVNVGFANGIVAQDQKKSSTTFQQTRNHNTEQKRIHLPPPNIHKSKSLMEALKSRQSVRDFTEKPFDYQMISNLLWSANGINREDGRRTAPSARNFQEIEIYIVTEEGAFFWEAKDNTLICVNEKDVRKYTGLQEFVSVAALNVILVYNGKKVKEMTPRQLEYAFFDAGTISQNISLYCASEEWGTVVRGMFDEKDLAEQLGLSETQKIIMTQTVGFQKK